MNKEDIKIGQEVFVIKRFGSIKDDFDMQILDYEVGWIGEDSIIVKYYQQYKNPEIEFGDLHNSLKECFEIVKNMPYFKDKKVRFEKICGDSYNVRWDD